MDYQTALHARIKSLGLSRPGLRTAAVPPSITNAQAVPADPVGEGRISPQTVGLANTSGRQIMAIDCGGRIAARAGRHGKNHKLNKKYLTLDSPVRDCSRRLLYQIHDNVVRRVG